jgi:hypothetical protein
MSHEISANKPQLNEILNWLNFKTDAYIYTHTCVCVCVCVVEKTKNALSQCHQLIALGKSCNKNIWVVKC